MVRRPHRTARRGEHRGGRDERGFWDRASDEVASWFGDDDAERRRRQDTSARRAQMDGDRRDRGFDRGRHSTATVRPQRVSSDGGRSDRDFNYDRGVFNRGGSSERD